MKISGFQAVGTPECPRIRLASGSIAAVDRCDCGMFQLHLGAFTLRLAPEALSSLHTTLGEAIRASELSQHGTKAALDNGRWSQS